jgi:hypothetical protein
MAQSIATATSDKVMADKMRALCEELMSHVEEERKKENN